MVAALLLHGWPASSDGTDHDGAMVGGLERDERTSIGGDYGWYATVVDPFGNPIGLTTATPTA